NSVANQTMLDLPLELLSTVLLCLTGLPWWLFEFWSWAQFTYSAEYHCWMLTLFYLAAMAVFMLFSALRRRPLRWGRGAAAVAGVTALCLALSSVPIVTSDALLIHPLQRVMQDKLRLYEYQPFREDNRLAVPDTPASLAIAENHPRLDGATAAYPFYAAAAQATYKGLDDYSVNDVVACSTTADAYERLFEDRIDIFFGAEPSAAQRAEAEQRGLTLHMTPLSREAFVFFVHKSNPVDSLTIEQVRAIYRREITNWKDLGGRNRAILPFQREEGSGSQTIMQKLMGEGGMAEPLTYEQQSMMGGMIDRVADYRNAPGAIGYSFRYFTNEMYQNKEIKLLAIEGVAPTVENIKNGSYPFITDAYAVTTKEPTGHVKALLDWLTGPEGQALIEKAGGVPLGET
ncbi:MAG: substrate-binding domain-containing protein, partial [Clostridia bacterium]|nr:substrate-binding domain-containing protein [Clostridia bacterium]